MTQHGGFAECSTSRYQHVHGCQRVASRFASFALLLGNQNWECLPCTPSAQELKVMALSHLMFSKEEALNHI